MTGRDIGIAGIGWDMRLRKLRLELVDELAESMRSCGLLQPIVVCPSPSTGFNLIAGRHRLEAARKLKWESIRAEVWPELSPEETLLAEIDENLTRGELSPVERAIHVAKRKEIYEAHHPKTKKGGDRKSTKSRSQNGTLIAPAFIDDTSAKTGKGRTTVARDAKRGKLPDLADAVGTSLDKGGELDALCRLDGNRRAALIKRAAAGEKVSARAEVKKVAREAREAALGGKQLALPAKRYGVILADPEWRCDPWCRASGSDRSADNHYVVSATEIIKARPVESIAAPDCVLFLWAIPHMLLDALAVMSAWGFSYKTQYVWGKDRIGLGYWNRNKHELLLIGVRGKPVAPALGTQRPSLQIYPVREHSRKPDEFRQMIEDYYPTTPKIELNCRGPARDGWDAWGNEAEAGFIKANAGDRFTEPVAIRGGRP